MKPKKYMLEDYAGFMIPVSYEEGNKTMLETGKFSFSFELFEKMMHAMLPALEKYGNQFRGLPDFDPSNGAHEYPEYEIEITLKRK